MKYIVLWVGMNEDFVKGSKEETDLILLCYYYKARCGYVVLKSVDKRRCY